MDVMEARRRLLMMQSEPAERWDYTILPDDGTSHGRIRNIQFNVTSGQTITVQYQGISQRDSNALFDGYWARTTPVYIVALRDLETDDGTYIFIATQDGICAVGASRAIEVGTLTWVSADWIKVRID